MVLGLDKKEGDGVRRQREEREAGRGSKGEGIESGGKRRCNHENRKNRECQVIINCTAHSGFIM